MGEVWKAQHCKTKQLVALKLPQDKLGDQADKVLFALQEAAAQIKTGGVDGIVQSLDWSPKIVRGMTDAEVRQMLGGGTEFNVLDITGDWAWGQVGEDGFVGYLPMSMLEERRD